MALKRSHWIGARHESGDVDQHLLTFAPHAAASLEDLHLAQRIGELDPFVAAAEKHEDMLPNQVGWFLTQTETGT